MYYLPDKGPAAMAEERAAAAAREAAAARAAAQTADWEEKAEGLLRRRPSRDAWRAPSFGGDGTARATIAMPSRHRRRAGWRPVWTSSLFSNNR